MWPAGEDLFTMKPAGPAARVAALREELEAHNRRYYEQAAPTISDPEYDALFRELRELEEAHPELAHARLAHAARGRPADRGLSAGAARGADALAR